MCRRGCVVADGRRARRVRADNERLAAEREHYRELYLRTLAQCRKLEPGLLGQKAGPLSPNDAQLTMQVLATLLGLRSAAIAPDQSVDDQRIREHTRAKPTGRKGGDAFDTIGEDISETVERRPASLVVVRVHRPKFVRKDRLRAAETEVVAAPPPLRPIERGLAGPGLMADTIVRRWQDHLPLDDVRLACRARP